MKHGEEVGQASRLPRAEGAFPVWPLRGQGRRDACPTLEPRRQRLRNGEILVLGNTDLNRQEAGGNLCP
ncbi:MAG TPA: hypothetical protein VFT34_12900 [Verrucomicrobiae bacterium]|nr:hypothetical protein [Verrucomicrobiae bacterium]